MAIKPVHICSYVCILCKLNYICVCMLFLCQMLSVVCQMLSVVSLPNVQQDIVLTWLKTACSELVAGCIQCARSL